ncbi:MAG TPA: ATP-binding protein [Steroidobacteraceae bacterium]|nr:ATP-binding protein [Steroidobacteraceae bacterium]
MSIRLQLLVVALTTLVLPWAGCQYARELETALRDSQEKSLLASAGTIANALSAQPQRVFRGPEDSPGFAPGGGDLYVYPLRSVPLLDGYRDDWGVAAEPTALPSFTGYDARVQAGATEHYLYLYIEVDDAEFDAEPSNVRLDRDRFDRIDLTLERPDGTQDSYFFGTNAPGLIGAQKAVKGDAGPPRVLEEPRIQAFWLQTSAGYHAEARIPLSYVATRLWVEVLDGRGPRRAGVTAAGFPQGGRLFFTMPGLDALLGTFIRDGTRATVIDANALKLGAAGSLSANAADETEADAGSWYRRFMSVDTSSFPLEAAAPDRLGGNSVSAALAGLPHAEWVRSAGAQELRLTAAAPLIVDGRTRGAVVLEQAGDQLLGLRDRAVTRLFNLTLLATAAAVVVMFCFATWISLRIGRLRNAADSAVGSDGKIRLDMPESASGDEIGALSRGFERLLARLNEHTQYLRTLGGKLSHELRTPLTIVRSSLDNLESEGLRDDQRRYVTRAREGTQRLQSILSALGAAARVEESIKQAECVNFDLRELLSSALAAYRDGFSHAHFALQTPGDPCFVRGAPDLIVQLLDKLIENAVDFCPSAGTITVRLERAQGSYLLLVENDGPPIPQALHGRLFESLFEQRHGRDDRPHFGLGLYIVRLVAEFHGGTAVAANRSDGGGAIFTITLPLI